MKRWLVVGVGLLMLGCATGMPGSAHRSFYNLCVTEGKHPLYCEDWAAVEAHKLAAGTLTGAVVIPVVPGR